MKIPSKWIIAAALIILVTLAAWWLVGSLSHGKRAATEAKVEASRGDAMAQSGADAVGTVGTRNAAEDDTDGRVQETHDAIDDADDLGGADTAARSGLCDLAPDYC